MSQNVSEDEMELALSQHYDLLEEVRTSSIVTPLKDANVSKILNDAESLKARRQKRIS